MTYSTSTELFTFCSGAKLVSFAHLSHANTKLLAYAYTYDAVAAEPEPLADAAPCSEKFIVRDLTGSVPPQKCETKEAASA